MSIDAPEPTTQSSAEDALRAKQIREAEELTESAPGGGGFARALFKGEFHAESLYPYPTLSAAERPKVEEAVAAVRAFADAKIDAAAIDREADIPQVVVHGLAELGVLGMTAPEEFGGRGFSQQGYCRIMEEIGRAHV